MPYLPAIPDTPLRQRLCARRAVPYPAPLIGLSLVLLLGAFQPASALYRFSHGTLIGNAGASIEATDNVRGRADSEGDLIATFFPSLSYQSEGAVVQTSVSAGLAFIRYNELTENNSENIRFNAAASFPNGMESDYSLSFAVGVNEATGADVEFGEVSRTRAYSAGLSGSYRFQNGYNLNTGLDYRLTQGLNRFQNDTQSWSVPVSINYRYSELLSYGLGYRVRRQISENTDNELVSWDHAVFAKADGQLLPSVSGGLQLGVQLRSRERANGADEDEVGPYASGDLDWQVNDLTSVGFGISADFDTSTANRSKQAYGINANLSHTFGPTWSGNLNFGWTYTTFEQTATEGEAREENRLRIGAGLSKQIGEYVQTSLRANYSENISNRDSADFGEASLVFNLNFPF
jgi:hypothetical protein